MPGPAASLCNYRDRGYGDRDMRKCDSCGYNVVALLVSFSFAQPLFNLTFELLGLNSNILGFFFVSLRFAAKFRSR